MRPTYEAASGTAGGSAFGDALGALARTAQLDASALARRAELPLELVAGALAGEERLTVAAMARLAHALGLRSIEFLQQSGLLSLEVYAGGLDPLYFLPDGPVRHQARIYMREINPRHPVPETEMLKRNPVLGALPADELLDPVGRLEVELTYLLAAAVRHTGGTL